MLSQYVLLVVSAICSSIRRHVYQNIDKLDLPLIKNWEETKEVVEAALGRMRLSENKLKC